MKPFSLEQLASNLPDSLKGFVMDESWFDALNEAWFFLTGPSGAGARYSRTSWLCTLPQACHKQTLAVNLRLKLCQGMVYMTKLHIGSVLIHAPSPQR